MVYGMMRLWHHDTVKSIPIFGVLADQKEVGYCWPTPKGRNLSVQDAFFEGKKLRKLAQEKYS
jgi:hypothetical protein